MSNNSNFFPSSQLSNFASDQNKITDSLYRCSEPEILLIHQIKIAERGIGVADTKVLLQYSDAAASSILLRLTDNTRNHRLLVPLLRRERCGARGSLLYFVNKEVKLEDIEKVIKVRGYSYQKFIENKNKRFPEQDHVIYQNPRENDSTDVLLTSTHVNHQEEEKPQIESRYSRFDSDDNQETNLTDLSEFTENEFPFMFSILKRKLVEKDKQLKQLQEEYEKLLSSLLSKKAG